MYDIFYIGKKDKQFTKLKESFITIKQADSFEIAQKKCITKFFWCVWDDIIVIDDFIFDYTPDDYSQDVVHTFKNNELYDGVWLVPKNNSITAREIEYRFLVSKKEVNILASEPKPYDYFLIDSWEDYQHALEVSSTTMFFASSANIVVDNNFINRKHQYSIYENHAFIHRVGNKDLYNGLFLLSKKKPVSKKEIEYRYLVERKEWDIVASGPTEYFRITVDSYADYEYAMTHSPTELFYAIPRQVDITNMPSLYFSHDDEYNRKENHTFKNICNDEEKDNGVFLCSKHKPISKREIEYRHIVHKKTWDIVVSKHKSYDVVFISYDESNADEHYYKLLEKAPHATRVHGVKGIHQAHIQAAKQSQSEMVWIVDADALLMDNFNFDLYIEKWDRETVHVWRSKNPINDLVYGYGGVKLLPRGLTLDMDTSKPDMTTSISNKFKAIPKISNITAFNTDPFSSWKSAFRECCKLSSKIIDRQQAEETMKRLQVWTTVGKDKPFGKFAISGAKAGVQYGEQNKNNINALYKINDFDWLKAKFDEYN